MKKILVFIIISCFLISGCGNKADDKTGTPSEVMMWLIGSEDQAITIQSLAEDFYKKTGIKVRCEAISWGDAHSKYLTSIAGQVAPDIGTMGLTWGTEFGTLGSMVDLAAAYPEEVKAIKKTIFSGLWNSIEYKGKVYGVPFDMTEYVVYYRNDILKESPRTWEELAVLLRELNKSGKGMLFDWGSLSWIGYSPFLWQAGGDYYLPDHSKSTIDSPEAETAMNFFTELYTKYDVPKTKIPLEQGIRTGDFPIAISGNWKIDDLNIFAPEIAGKWAIAMMPKGPSGKRTGFIGGRIMGIFEQSKHKKEAWAFILYLSNPEIQKFLYEAAVKKQDTYLPPNKETWPIIDMEPKFKKILFDQAEDSKGPPAIANWDAYTRHIDNVIQRAILQGDDPKAGLSEVKKALELAVSRSQHTDPE